MNEAAGGLGFVYRWEDGNLEPCRIVKRTRARVFIRAYDYLALRERNYALKRAELEERGWTEQGSKGWDRELFFVTLEAYQNYQAALPPHLRDAHSSALESLAFFGLTLATADVNS